MSRTSLSELAQRCRTAMNIYVGTFWRHEKTQGIYKITGISVDEATNDLRFHYAPALAEETPALTGLVFSRPQAEWMEGETPRFRRVRAVKTFVAA